MLTRSLSLVALVLLVSACAFAAPPQTEPQAIVVDPSGAAVASVWDGRVTLEGRPVQVKREGQTFWWLDDMGKPQGGIRFAGGRYEVLTRGSRTPTAKVSPTAFGWRGDGFDVRRVGNGFEGRRDGQRVCLAQPRGNVVDLADASGKVRCSARGLTPDRVVLWWMSRGTPEEAAWLAVLAPAKK